MSEPTLRSGLRRRLVGVALLAGLAGASAAVVASVSFQRRTVKTVVRRSWEMSGRARFLDACEANPEGFSLFEPDGVDFHAYDADGRASFVEAPAMPEHLLAEARSGEPMPLELLDGDPFGGRALLRGALEPDSPCAYALMRWKRRPEMREHAIWAGATTLISTLIVTALLALFLLVRPVRARVARLRRAARSVGRDSYAPGDLEADDELGDVTRAVDQAHHRVLSDQATILAQREELERFVADIAHDLRTPITSLQLALETLADAALDEEARASLRSATNDAVYLASLTTNLRLATRLGEGWNLLDGDPRVDLAEVVARVEGRERVFARRQGIELVASVPDEPVHVCAEPTWAEQMITNLVQNAIAYGEHGGHVAVVLRRSADGFSLVVEDDGPGVAPDELPRLGDRTFRSDAARARDPKGSGLGLAIVREGAERFGWSVAYARREPRGLQVSLKGPRREAKSHASTPAPEASRHDT
ncbi:MAG: HAMP domain-containing histidine kinase [Sandaracinus sp.]|nr:HAMP domain-containing histidine kinase [Sandaracinus sp.]